MTNAEGEKLSNIADNAQVNKIEVIKVNDVALTVAEADKSVNIVVPTAPVQGVAADEKLISLDGDKLKSTLTLAYVPASKNENDEHVPAQLRLQGIGNEVISSIDADKFVKDGMIETVVLDGPNAELGETGKKYLAITWNVDSGKEVTRLDVSELFNPYTADNGVVLVNGNFSLKLATGEQYLTVGTDGLATTEALWNKGIIVVAAAGNSGPEYSTIKSPGVSPKIITVGAFDDNRLDNASFDPTFFEIAQFSSRGPAFDGFKPDLVAPAVDITSCGIENNYTTLSGTSVACPMIAGICALLLQQNPSFSPSQIKTELLSLCRPITFNQNKEGSGYFSFNNKITP
jgi:subtilisin family serine protease